MALRRFVMFVLVAVAVLTALMPAAFADPQLVTIDTRQSEIAAETPAELVPGSAAGVAFTAATPRFVAQFASSADGAGISIATPLCGTVTMATRGMVAAGTSGEILDRLPVRPTIADAEGHLVRYPHAMRGVDDEFRVYQSRIKHDAVLAGPLGLSGQATAIGLESRVQFPEAMDCPHLCVP